MSFTPAKIATAVTSMRLGHGSAFMQMSPAYLGCSHVSVILKPLLKVGVGVLYSKSRCSHTFSLWCLSPASAPMVVTVLTYSITLYLYTVLWQWMSQTAELWYHTWPLWVIPGTDCVPLHWPAGALCHWTTSPSLTQPSLIFHFSCMELPGNKGL